MFAFLTKLLLVARSRLNSRAKGRLSNALRSLANPVERTDASIGRRDSDTRRPALANRCSTSACRPRLYGSGPAQSVGLSAGASSEQFAKRARRCASTALRLQIRKLAPILGADNEAILNELGCSANDIERLKRNRILHA
jgi:hypothetical protein